MLQMIDYSCWISECPVVILNFKAEASLIHTASLVPVHWHGAFYARNLRALFCYSHVMWANIAIECSTFMQTHSDIGNVMTTSNHDNAVSAQSQKPKLGLFSSANSKAQHHRNNTSTVIIDRSVFTEMIPSIVRPHSSSYRTETCKKSSLLKPKRRNQYCSTSYIKL